MLSKIVIKIVYVSFLSFVFISCGNSSDSKMTFYQPPAVLFSPHILTLDDPKCQISGLREDKKINFKNWRTQKVSRFRNGVQGNFDEVFNVGDDSIIEKILIPGGTYLGDFEKDELSVASQLSDFQQLQLCSDNTFFGHYSEDSVEMMALATYATINESYAFYRNVASDNLLQKNKMKLLVGPLISRTSNGVDYLTDNAFYSNVKGFGDLLVVIPHSDEFETSLYKMYSHVGFIPFWKQQFVVVHEFGHYVFENHSKISEIDKGENRFHASSLQNAAKSASVFGKVEMNSIGKISILSSLSLHEGFADLFAVLATGENANNMIFDPDKRNVFSDVYVGFQKEYKKILSESVLNSGEFAESHALGAVLAYSVYHTINELFPAANSMSKGKILILWADEIYKNRGHLDLLNYQESLSGDHQKYHRAKLKVYIEVLYSVLRSQSSSLTTRDMDNVFHKYFPVFI